MTTCQVLGEIQRSHMGDRFEICPPVGPGKLIDTSAVGWRSLREWCFCQDKTRALNYSLNSENRHSCESRNPVFSRPSGFPPEFTPYLIRGGNDKVGIFFKALKTRILLKRQPTHELDAIFNKRLSAGSFQIFPWRISLMASERRVTFSRLQEKPISPIRQIFPFRGPNPPAMSML